MNIDQRGLELIKDFEGFRDEAYKDTGGVWTIGYGTIRYPSGTPVEEGDGCDEEQAEEYLMNDVASSVQAVNDYITVELNQNQFDALVSFTYNLGVGALKNSTLRKLVNAQDFQNAAKEFMKWCHCDGQVVPGLLARRTKESYLFLSEN